MEFHQSLRHTPAIFRFNDPVYGFVTPPAKFLSLGAIGEYRVNAVTLSPPVETLPLDESMAILIDLQSQLRRKGWEPIETTSFPSLDDTPSVRKAIRDCHSRPMYWQAADKYQVSIDIRCFPRESHPNEERYLITLQLGTPFIKDI